MKNFLFLILTFNFLIFARLYSADIPTAQFLLVGQGARAEAMGHSVVSNCFDYSALYWNPAASVFLKNPEFGFNYTKLPAEIDNGYLAFIYPYEKVAFGVSAIDEKTTLTGFDNNGIKSADITNEDTNFNFVFAYKILDSLSVGLGAGLVNMQLDTEKKDTTNAGIGTIFKKDRVSAGLTLANLGGKFKTSDGNGETQPQLVRAGISYSFMKDKNFTVTASYENVFDDDRAGIQGFGLEYFAVKFLALRGGFMITKEGNSKLSAGFGLNYNRFVLDYAFTLADKDLKDTEVNRISLAVKFGKTEEKAEAAAKPVVAQPTRKPGEIINIAVADFSGKNVSQADASIVADFLRTELVQTSIYNVIEKANMDKILAEAAFQQSGCTTSECAVQIGKLLNVRQMVVGTLSKLMDTYYITVNLVDVETGKIITSYDQEAMSAKELRTACKTLAVRISQ